VFAWASASRASNGFGFRVPSFRIRDSVSGCWVHSVGVAASVRRLFRGGWRVYAPHPTPYTLHPAPYTLHPTPSTLHPTRCTPHPTPHTPHPTPNILHPRMEGVRRLCRGGASASRASNRCRPGGIPAPASGLGFRVQGFYGRGVGTFTGSLVKI